MNGKQAKRLRREAEPLTIGAPQEEYIKAKDKRVAYKDKEGKKQVATITGAIALDPQCTKGKYRELKKDYKNGRR